MTDQVRTEWSRAPHGYEQVSHHERLPDVTFAASDEVIPGRPAWQVSLSRRLLISDLVVLVATAALAMVWKFGLSSDARVSGPLNMNYATFGGVIVLMWWATLAIFRTRDPRIIGEGSEEFRRVLRATVLVFGWIAILSLMFKWDMSRMYLAIAFPLGLLGLVAERKAWRIWLRSQRKQGLAVSKVLVVGSVRSASRIAANFDADPGSGHQVSGVWLRESYQPHTFSHFGKQLLVLDAERSLQEVLALSRADTVIVTDTEHLGHDGLRELMWDLEKVDVDLMVSPNLVDVAGARIHVRGVANMPFMHLEEPQYAEAGAWPKVVFDKTVATVILVAASPLLAVMAVIVRLTSAGPVLFRQERIGLDGAHFDMLKFRSMRQGAEAELKALMLLHGQAHRPLFKIQNDPRITRIGRFMRRYSVDELPQLMNVIRGDMSLVGPRPPLAAEVELYDDTAHRRLHVRPGMTGLWQVSGRSDLAWEDSIRLDTYYVENWSLTGDLVILWRTISAVINSRGAY